MVKKAKVLVVDDDPINRIVLKKTLGEEHDVFLVDSAEKALTFVKTTSVNLIILDIVMPEMNGYELLIKLKDDPATQTIPVIFISGNQSHVDESKGLELGAMDYITKPFSASIVQVRVRNQLLIKQKSDLLEMLASIDGLTEIPNRRYLDENLSREWRRSKRTGTVLSVLLIDIDFFKRYNDCYGHRAGDDCLKKVAQSISSECKRGSDFIARYGGEEFVAILPDITQTDAITFANQLRDTVKKLQIKHKASLNNDHITISIGVATMKNAELYSEQALLEKADLALYKAKAAGRDRVVAH